MSTLSRISNAQINGLLEKHGKLGKALSAKKYHCVLQEHTLNYYKDATSSSLAGAVDLSAAQSVRPGKGCTFEIITKARTHIFNAQSGELRDKWVKALQDAMSLVSRRISRMSAIRSERSCDSGSDEDKGSAAIYESVQDFAPQPGNINNHVSIPTGSINKHGAVPTGSINNHGAVPTGKVNNHVAVPKAEVAVSRAVTAPSAANTSHVEEEAIYDDTVVRPEVQPVNSRKLDSQVEDSYMNQSDIEHALMLGRCQLQMEDADCAARRGTLATTEGGYATAAEVCSAMLADLDPACADSSNPYSTAEEVRASELIYDDVTLLNLSSSSVDVIVIPTAKTTTVSATSLNGHREEFSARSDATSVASKSDVAVFVEDDYAEVFDQAPQAVNGIAAGKSDEEDNLYADVVDFVPEPRTTSSTGCPTPSVRQIVPRNSEQIGCPPGNEAASRPDIDRHVEAQNSCTEAASCTRDAESSIVDTTNRPVVLRSTSRAASTASTVKGNSSIPSSTETYSHVNGTHNTSTAPNASELGTLEIFVDFERTAIPELPHEREELKWNSAFDDIRKFIAANRGVGELYANDTNVTVDHNGQAVSSLRNFLKELD